MHDVLDYRELVSEELDQCQESGRDLGELAATAKAALAAGSRDELQRVLTDLSVTPALPGWPYEEPSELEAIEALTSSADDTQPMPSAEIYRDRVHAAWSGRCAGCVLGKPVEGWDREVIRDYLGPGGYPLNDYFPPPQPGNRFPLRDCWTDTTRGLIENVGRDDDIDYTILGLHILEEYGVGFTAEDVGREWLDHLPFTRVYTAERAVYRNLLLNVAPPQTATWWNPYREWIGAQIRADVWGYVLPGEPKAAARLAFEDASLSHTANGIYGAMWAAALIANCFVAPSMAQALDSSLNVVPPRSRLAEALRVVIELHQSGLDWELARDRLEEEFGHYGFVHTINNAAAVAAALLWGEGDYTRTICLAVQAGWDTDCNGATAGSAFGALHGSKALPARWIEPLKDHVRSAIFDFDNSTISDLAERTATLRLNREAAVATA
jgi:ADP-ribosylglycohydrolase